ncbi:MAG: L,D-transpeptidase family protein [Clostridiales bacterium]|nr:L,D-transpeptidase family protein [Clostridiales bacterium]
MKNILVFIVALALALGISALAEGETGASPLFADTYGETASPDWVCTLPQAKDASQLFIVAGIGMDKTTAYISMHRKTGDGTWMQILSTPGFVGKNGLCADADHKEGCGQTPAGVYRFNKAFGIAPDPGCALDYFQVDENTYWSGDPERFYNQMVDIRDVPELLMDDSEHIVDYEFQYRYCLNISFNEDGTPGRGSAIFLHCFGPQKPWTGGCVAVPENVMKRIMQSVTEDCVVVIDTLENLGGSL